MSARVLVAVPPARRLWCRRAGSSRLTPRASVTVVGLGPGDPKLLTREAHELLTGAKGPVFVRTATHPTLKGLPGLQLRSFDDVYDSANLLQDVYPLIVDRLLAAAATQDVLYAVPGDPCVAEKTVLLLRERAAQMGVEVRLAADTSALLHAHAVPQVRMVSALSFIEPLLAALGVDCLPSLWIGDALDVAAAAHPPFCATAPALLSQLHSRAVASELKLTLMEGYPEDHRVALVHGAGDSVPVQVDWLPLHQIDFSAAIGARTSLYVPALAGQPSLEAVLGGCAAARDALEGPWREGDPSPEQAAAELLSAAQRVSQAAERGDQDALRGALLTAARARGAR